MLSKKLEFWGLSLILASSFIHVFLLTPSRELTDEAVRWKLERKIDLIYSATRSNYQKLHPDVLGSVYTFDPKMLNNYTYANQNKEFGVTKGQTTLFGWIVAGFFLIGSGLVLSGKYLEIKEK